MFQRKFSHSNVSCYFHRIWHQRSVNSTRTWMASLLFITNNFFKWFSILESKQRVRIGERAAGGQKLARRDMRGGQKCCLIREKNPLNGQFVPFVWIFKLLHFALFFLPQNFQLLLKNKRKSGKDFMCGWHYSSRRGLPKQSDYWAWPDKKHKLNKFNECYFFVLTSKIMSCTP